MTAAKDRAAQTVNVLDLSRRMAIDVVTGYLFEDRYDAFGEMMKYQDKANGAQAELTASAFVDAFVSVGAFLLLPTWLFGRVLSFLDWYSPDQAAKASEDVVNLYTRRIVQQCVDDPLTNTDTYQSRLLNAGITPDETRAQCKDVMFAGTDSTSTNLASIAWHVCKQPDLLKRLCIELSSADALTSTPLLHATVREGLRLGMANPTRLARVVPGCGWQWNKLNMPADTIVGCSSYCLHHDPRIFSEPFSFRPDQWQHNADGAGEVDLTNMRSAWLAFGAGARQCIARTLATEEITLAINKLVQSRVLEGASAVGDSVEHLDWFNSRTVGGKIEISFAS